MASERPEILTIVFTDLVGSTAWRTRVGEQLADERTADLERWSREVVVAAGGSVVKSTGDGVMATFPSASAALDAAASLQHVARRAAVGDTAACLRVGVSTGELLRHGDDWSGAAAIEASRLCAEADGGMVLVADVAARIGRGRTSHVLRSAGMRTLRGFDEPTEVFELLAVAGPRPVPPPLARAAGVPLVGRFAEQAQLERALRAVAAGDTVTVLIVGEAGVGKTRLAAAAAEMAAELGLVVLHGRCDERSAAPYQPFVEAIGPWLEDLHDVVLRRVVGAGGGSLASLWPGLVDRLPGAHTSGDPESERWQLVEAVATLLGSPDEPVLLVIDDLQWAEPSTRFMLAHLVRRSVPSLAVVATVRRSADRTALFGDLGTGVIVDELELDGLHEADVTELVERHVGHRPPDQLSRKLWRQTDGNPFFLGALLAHLDHVTVIRNDDGVWATTEDLGVVGVPDDVRAVVRRRLAVLGDHARRALDVAAVSGLAFDETTVRGVLGSSVDDNVEAMDQAVDVGVVREEGPGRFAFVHALVRDALIDDLSVTRLARLHWRTGEVLDQRVDRDARLDEIAGHYAAGGGMGDPATLLRASLEAGEDAMSRLAFEEAAGHFQTALATLDRLPTDPDVRYLVLTSLGRALNASTGAEAANALWLEAATIAEASNDPQRIFDALVGYDLVVRLQDQGTVIRFLDGVLRLVGPDDSPLRARALAWRHERTMRGMGTSPDPSALDEAVAMARRTGDRNALASVLQARMVVRKQGPDAEGMLLDAEELASENLTDERWMLTSRDVARALVRLGRRREADAHAAINRQDAERSGLRMAINGALMLQSSIAIASGDFATGKLLAAEAAGRPAGRPDILARAYGAQLVALRHEQGRTDAVIASLRTLDRDMVALTPWVSMLASVLAEIGELDDARIELQRLSPRLERGFSALNAGPVALRYIAEACLRLGDQPLANRLIRHVEPWSGTLLVFNTSIEGAAHRSLGHLQATVGRLDEAINAYAAAGELERRAEFPPLHARTAYWHARTLLERNDPGDRERAAALLSETTDITSRLGMRLLHHQAAELSRASALA